jgi:hypothetical protein
MTAARPTRLATPVDLRRYRNASDAELGSRLHPDYEGAIRRLPSGPSVIRGIPFRFARARSEKRWLMVHEAVELDLRGVGPASHVVVAHFCDAWRDAETGRPPDLPIGWVTPAGQPLARYSLVLRSGATRETVVRRRFEVNEGIVGWGQNAFAATPHMIDAALDWRGPYPAMGTAQYASAGEAGLLGVLPGSWGPAQTGVTDSVPSPTGDIVLWLHVIEVPDGPARLDRFRMEPLSHLDDGGAVIVAAITAFRGTASPLAVSPRRTLRVRGAAGESVAIDLGQVYRERPAPARTAEAGSARVVGWGTPRADPGTGSGLLVDLAFAPDATLAVGSDLVPADRLPPEGQARRLGRLTIESLPTPTRRLDVEVVDAAKGRPMPARVRFQASDGRYLPPLGHRDEINPGLNEDSGADVVLGAATYAYVPGRFPIVVPNGPVQVEVVHGFGHRPLRRTFDGATVRGPLVLPVEAAGDLVDPAWVAVDCHVHFISPTSALLQARAEGVAIVNLLATQWGDHHTSVADLPASVVSDAAGEHLVVMGSENRQNVLGHIGLLGASDPVLPMASAGPPEARLGDPLEWLIGDWADAAREQGGLAIAVHFPLPYAEIAADIVSGRIDAVELQALTADVDGPSIREWYRFLNCGFRLPVVGGTDKMSAEIPLGAIRTYARLDPDEPLSFAAWAAAVRAGRTFVSSGTFIQVEVEGCEPGDTVALRSGGGTVEVRARASAAQPLIDRLELVHDGRVVASTSAGGADLATIGERVEVSKSGWIAARATSRSEILSGFSTGMGAHSSPIYLDVPDRAAWAADDAAAIATIIDGARTWVEKVAVVRSAAERTRLAAHLEASRRTLDKLARERSRRSTR